MKNEIVRDKFGPEYVIEVYDATTGMRGFLVIDNTVMGRGKGGIRMTPDVTPEEVFRLARTMTWKNALAELPFGGAKAGIVWSGGDNAKKEELVRAFARAVKPFLHKYYVGGPDVGSGEVEMQWIAEEARDLRAVTGKPANMCMVYMGGKGEKCGLPHEYGSTGMGAAHATKVAAHVAGMKLEGATVAIHGFGNVGSFVFNTLRHMGAKVVAVADRDTGLFDEAGLHEEIFVLGAERKPLAGYKKAKHISPEEVLAAKVDILIPASVTDVIHQGNKKNVRAKIIVEAGNIPMSEAIEQEFYEDGVLVIPDFVANAGGVISSYAEYRGYNPKRMFALVERKITKNTRVVLRESKRQGISPREAAMRIAIGRVERKRRVRAQKG
ncbi:MAG: Glu/Leu/Phe/Val dehydrogenase [Candidatus Spechtbacterales bacterium]